MDSGRPGPCDVPTLGYLWPVLPVLMILLNSPIAQASTPGSPAPVTRYAVVITGSELLSGAYADGHTHFITRTLHPLGLQCVSSMCVPDSAVDMRRALEFSAQGTDLVIVTGGLGPTDNDLTRKALTDFTGIALKENAEALRDLARRFRVPPEDLRENLRRQIQAPTQGSTFKNMHGTAVGLVFEKARQVIVALPGPPRELQPMVRDALVPYLSQRFGTRLPGSALTLRFVGLGQSHIDQVLSDHIALPPGISLSSQFQGGRVDFTFSLPTDTPQDRKLLKGLKRDIERHLGEHIYADDGRSLEEHVLRLFRAQGITLALTELGSAGHLTAALMQVPKAPEVLVGSYVAPTAEGLRTLLDLQDSDWSGLSSEQRTAHLARATAEATGSQWALAISAPETTSRGRRVGVTLRRPHGQIAHQSLPFYGRGESAYTRLSTQVLDLLRRQLKRPTPAVPVRSDVTH